ncbi:D-isomer specific 2-hydroxyacid dehydrogenase [Amylocystis lapponica]|nr:D-isomer specific 2-hydroxyacid dehydrogenase [Amylocystis lapponica]
MPRVLLCGDLVWAHKECEEMFKGIAEVVPLTSPDRADFIAGLQPGGKYDSIVGMFYQHTSARFIGPLNAELIGALAVSVKWIAHNGAGYDQVDVQACKAHGIYVSNTPGAVDYGTATTALYLLISAMRRFSSAERAVRSGSWKTLHKAKFAHDLEGHTLAILGMGGVGLRLAQYVHAFPMRVIYHNRNKVANAPDWIEYYPAERLDEMLAEADVLSVHVPLRKETTGLVDETMIRKLKQGAVIINTARGKVIDEEAMIRALEDRHLGAIGLDVYPNEPEVNPRLLEFPNAILLPHMGTETLDSQKRMEVRALTNLRDYLTKGAGADIIPELR